MVLTLLYLARETRKNAQALDATSTREFGLRLSELHRAVAENPELKRILIKVFVKEPPELSAEEWFEFRVFAVSLFLIYQTSYMHLSHDLGNREESENYIRVARGLIESWPAYRRFWDEEAETLTFTRGFIDAVNSASAPGSFTHMAESKVLGDLPESNSTRDA